MTLLVIIGRLFNAALGWALPGVSASALYLVAGLLAIGVPAGWAYHKGASGCAASLAAEKAACSLKIANMQTATDRTISDILSSVADEDQTSENVGQYCKRNPGLCRTEGGE